LSSTDSILSRLDSFGPLRRLMQWLDAVPHPLFVCEIASTHVAIARWGHRRFSLDAHSVEPLPEGAVTPSAVETNITNPEAVRSALRRVLSNVPARREELALLVPDPVVRVFILPFDSFPRRPDEAMPMLRWRLKKSVPFDVEETVISAMRQEGRNGSLEIVAALARQGIMREYEEVIEAEEMVPGVVLSSTLAALPMVADQGATLVARMTGTGLTTAIVRGETLCFYRSSEMGADSSGLETKVLLDEIFPAIAYYQDSWSGAIGRVRLSGFGDRLEEFREAVGTELGCAVLPLEAGLATSELSGEVHAMMRENLAPLVGWTMNRGA
jgi:type IV pilus assembly protein PilM